MRLFIAINFNDDIKNKLASEIAMLKQHSLSGTFSRKENLHLTVIFLGEVSDNRLNEIQIAMKKVSVGHSTSTVTVKGFGKFFKNKEILYWRGMECSNEVLEIRSKLMTELKRLGFKLDQKAFVPHITMGRRIVMNENFAEGDYENLLQTMDMLVDEICLMKSERIRGRMVYTKVGAAATV